MKKKENDRKERIKTIGFGLLTNSWNATDINLNGNSNDKSAGYFGSKSPIKSDTSYENPFKNKNKIGKR